MAALYTIIVPRSPFFAFYTPNTAGYKNDIKCGGMSASIKWRFLGNLQLLSRTVAVVAEMEVSPQEGIADPQGIKMFAGERHGLPEDFVYFPVLCGVQSSPRVFLSNPPIVWDPLQ